MSSVSPSRHGKPTASSLGNSPNQPSGSRSGCHSPVHQDSPSAQTPSAKASASKGKGAIACRFFTSRKGCRDGSSCLYLHDIPAASGTATLPQLPAQQQAALGSNTGEMRQVTSRPIPSLQRTDPRQFEINQLQKRFSPSIHNTSNAAILKFKLAPTDPDFPFDLAGLNCTLTIPNAYPKDSRPSLRVTNEEMERGYQINIERGFDALATQLPRRTLLGLLNELDKKLESLLTSEKVPTIKIISNAAKKETAGPLQPAHRKPAPTSQITRSESAKSFTMLEIQAASTRRTAELQQLEARLGRDPLFSKMSELHGMNPVQVFQIPLRVKAGNLPADLHSMQTVRLTVPKTYPLLPCTVDLKNGSEAAHTVKKEFEKHVLENPGMTLMSHMNYLSQNIHKMALTESKKTPLADEAETAVQEPESESQKLPTADIGSQHEQDQHSNLIIIPRPPEWDMMVAGSGDEDSSDMSDSEYETGSEEDEEEEEDGGAPVPESERASGPERGVMISLPQLEMFGIELLEIAALSLTVKCDRCKELTDIKNISSSNSTSKTESCKKCASVLSVAYRGEPMHANSVKAGYLDLEGCSVVDLLPSTFKPTCSECSTVYTSTSVISVRGETSLNMCRSCHHKMTFTITDVKFLRVSANVSNQPLPPRKRTKEKLGIVSGTELPNRGRCKHYAKSYRWFRFGCCGRVYPCDRCHDEKEEHPNEHAGRMICGWCSREQVYRVGECGVCGKGVVGRKGGGFWEGGKGTRDQVKMSRKDGRKWKRRGGGGGGAK